MIDTRELEDQLKQNDCEVRILYCEDIGNKYWIVYTTDMLYTPETPLCSRDRLYEQEEDIIATDMGDAFMQIFVTSKEVGNVT